jgi:tRNA (mo5U34)-methyltransferase
MRRSVDIAEEVEKLGPWFHNLDLDGVMTAPEHSLGDHPREYFERFAHAIPDDLDGKTVLDIGCNAGFYSIEMKRRGASRVVAIDIEEACLAQAQFAAMVTETDIELRKMSVYDVAALREAFDIVLFMGVLEHLRHPLLALDTIRECVVRGTLIFQSTLRGAADDGLSADDDAALHFVENEPGNDDDRCWIPNAACVEAMLKSAGFRVTARLDAEVYMCERADDDEAAAMITRARSSPIRARSQSL